MVFLLKALRVHWGPSISLYLKKVLIGYMIRLKLKLAAIQTSSEAVAISIMGHNSLSVGLLYVSRSPSPSP